jgi:hypothetical protein
MMEVFLPLLFLQPYLLQVAVEVEILILQAAMVVLVGEVGQTPEAHWPIPALAIPGATAQWKATAEDKLKALLVTERLVVEAVLELLVDLRRLPLYRAVPAESVLCGRAVLVHIMVVEAAVVQVRPALVVLAVLAAVEMVLLVTLRLKVLAEALLVIQARPTREVEVAVRGILQHPEPQVALA